MIDSSHILRIVPLAKGTMSDHPKAPAQPWIFLQPDIAAVLTTNDRTACKMWVAIQTNVDDDFSIADVDLQRHGSIVALGVAIAESAD